MHPDTSSRSWFAPTAAAGWRYAEKGGHDSTYWHQNTGRYLRFYAGALAPAQGR